jgi:hypothetical protein
MQHTYLFYALLTVSILHTWPTTRKSSRNYDRRILRNMHSTILGFLCELDNSRSIFKIADSPITQLV